MCYWRSQRYHWLLVCYANCMYLIIISSILPSPCSLEETQNCVSGTVCVLDGLLPPPHALNSSSLRVALCEEAGLATYTCTCTSYCCWLHIIIHQNCEVFEFAGPTIIVYYYVLKWVCGATHLWFLNSLEIRNWSWNSCQARLLEYIVDYFHWKAFIQSCLH